MMLPHMQIKGSLAAAILGITFVTAPTLGQCEYEVEIIYSHECGGGGLPFNALFSPKGMNDLGWVVGVASLCSNTGFQGPAIWKPGWTESQALPTPDWFVNGGADDVNNHGVVLCHGSGNPKAGSTRPFLVHPDGTITELPGLEYDGYAAAHHINDDGVACGYAERGDLNLAVIWVDGEIVELETPPDRKSQARFVTPEGLVVGHFGRSWSDGTEPVIWENGKATILPIPDGMMNGRCLSANDRGVIVGTAALPGKHPWGITRPLEWVDGVVQELPVEYTSPEDQCGAGLVNRFGHIVGECVDAKGENAKVFWMNGPATELYQLLPAGEYELLTNFDAVNDLGQLVVSLVPIDGSVEKALITPMKAGGLKSDLTCDCNVNLADLDALFRHWDTADALADINADGIVGVTDLLILLSDWTG